MKKIPDYLAVYMTPIILFISGIIAKSPETLSAALVSTGVATGFVLFIKLFSIKFLKIFGVEYLPVSEVTKLAKPIPAPPRYTEEDTVAEFKSETPAETIARVQREFTMNGSYEEFHGLYLWHTSGDK